LGIIRCAILTAVSTPEQAGPDKNTLEHHEKACRREAKAQGWTETAGPFVVDGYSRSAYTNLSDAERDIPPLRAALEAMRQNRYDVLVVFSYDRLGDLTPFIANEFRNHKKQIYSVSQSAQVQEPAGYDPYSNESADIQQDVSRIVQRFRINDMRRKWRAGVPARVARGLTPLRVPFGFRWVSKKEPPARVEGEAALIYQMKDWLFSGISMLEIARNCDASHIKPPRGGKWDVGTIHYILSNPYYAGQVVLHKSVYVHDEKRKSRTRPIRQPEATWNIGQGRHEALWDEATYHSILRELERRREQNLRSAVRFPLSGLLTCSVCGQKLNRRSHGSGRGRHKVFRCRRSPAHVTIRYEDGLRLVGEELRSRLKDLLVNPPTKRQPDNLEPGLKDAVARRRRVQEGYETGLYSDAEAAQRLAEIDTTIDALRRQIEQARRSSEIAADFTTLLSAQDLERVPEWLATREPATVNRIVSALCQRIDLTPGGQVIIEFRQL
jgi:DNA invertase Pin-like site-specific DNA recombinase